LEETNKEEELYLERCRLRLAHLGEYEENPDEKSRTRWHKIKLDRLLVDYLLREGLYETAMSIAKESNITDLVDIEVFFSAKKVYDSLLRRETAEALKWCNDNKSRLKKLESSFEFEVRLQEYIEILRRGKLDEAIQYARAHLSSATSGDSLKKVQQAMTLVLFVNNAETTPYKELLDPHRWEELAQMFKQENYRLNCLSTEPLLTVHLQAGISSLKTPQCFREETKNVNCPVCNELISKLAKDLPYAHHVHTRLVCRLSGELMNEDNPPMMLPNGQVYSKKALEEMALKNNGKITCPETGLQYDFSELRRVYIT
jgi:macrophage erythroblast attacher